MNVVVPIFDEHFISSVAFSISSAIYLLWISTFVLAVEAISATA